jgi:hypothetical protein
MATEFMANRIGDEVKRRRHGGGGFIGRKLKFPLMLILLTMNRATLGK